MVGYHGVLVGGVWWALRVGSQRWIVNWGSARRSEVTNSEAIMAWNHWVIAKPEVIISEIPQVIMATNSQKWISKNHFEYVKVVGLES